MTLVYILKLSDGCFYVGATSFSIANCMKKHMAGHGEEWTKLHKPLVLVKQTEYPSSTNPRLQQDLQVKQLMLDHGMENIRGGSYSSIELTREQKSSLKKELWYADYCCCKCGNRRHLTEDCNAEKDGTGQFADLEKGERSETNDETSAISSLMSKFDSIALALLDSKDVEKRIKDCVRATRSLIDVTKMRSSMDACTPKKAYSNHGHKAATEKQKHASFDVTSSPDTVVTTTSLIASLDHEHTTDGSRPIARENKERKNEPEMHSDTSSLDTIHITESAIHKERHEVRKMPCSRCGKYSHHRSRCYEQMDVHGFVLSDCF
jgi:predicted GIY-YIG superfamily endonuclease